MYRGIKSGIDEIADGLRLGEISVFVGMSGGVTGDNKRLIGEFLHSLGFAWTGNGSDAENIVKAGIDDGNGVIVINGTGCSVFAKNGDALHRYGGLGWRFDRYGGGYDYGNLALRAAMQAEDGTGRPTMIRDFVLEKTGKKTVLEDLAYFYTLRKTQIAEFAPTVFRAYEKGDAVASEIIKDTCDYLAKLIVCACSSTVKSEGKYRVVFVGGLTKAFYLTEKPLKESLAKIADVGDFDISVYDKDAAYGAIYLAGLNSDRSISK